ncbi:hypothetical protein HYW18_02470 [Candidatus Uhrbacteria bacterium]|nr:hypothetical protein [Candidatus Uhrbacteria bacterium]
MRMLRAADTELLLGLFETGILKVDREGEFPVLFDSPTCRGISWPARSLVHIGERLREALMEDGYEPGGNYTVILPMEDEGLLDGLTEALRGIPVFLHGAHTVPGDRGLLLCPVLDSTQPILRRQREVILGIVLALVASTEAVAELRGAGIAVCALTETREFLQLLVRYNRLHPDTFARLAPV